MGDSQSDFGAALLGAVDAGDVDFSGRVDPDFSERDEAESDDPDELSEPLDPDGAFDSDLGDADSLAVDLPRLSVR